MASRRLLREYNEQKKNKEEDLTLVPDENNIFAWTARIDGPKDTPFEGGVFEVRLIIPQEYPIKPPKATFLTKIFHPNIHFKTGEVCLDILKTSWSPAWTLSTVMRAIITLLAHPEPSSPLNCDAGNLLRHGDIRGFNSMAKMYSKLYALEEKLRYKY